MSERLTITSYALLGQMALRPWGIYEMTQNMRRTVHWFWPRAESVIYSETRRLAEMGLLVATAQPGRRGRDQTVYQITDAGMRQLRTWLDSKPTEFSLHFEALLRVHLAPYGSKEDLLTALFAARENAEALLRQAMVVGLEFAEGRHQFQTQAHIRYILFDYLWSFGLMTYAWADTSIEWVKNWPDLEGSHALLKEARAMFAEALATAPPQVSA